MAKQIKLPSGATVTLKDPKQLRVKDRKKVILTTDSTEGDLSKAMALGEAILAMLIEDWSFDLVIPSVKLESLGELEMADYDYMIEQTKEAQKALLPSLTETESNSDDPKAITGDSNGSNG